MAVSDAVPGVPPFSPHTAEPTSSAGLLRPLAHLLDELGRLVARLSDEQFTRRDAAGVRGSIGGHLRHVLDHIATLVGAADSAEICYDQRARGTAVESSRAAAAEQISTLAGGLSRIAARSAHAPLRLSARLTPDGAMENLPTSLAREIAFVQSHTIHHNALIAALARVQGVELDDDFGFAPATLAYQRENGA
ncbi:MAG: hypothetical protein SF069_15925 [Phycisphaerae bacterium]|nr:hypothetical protein [Phycisphaerae bacterium]